MKPGREKWFVAGYIFLVITLVTLPIILAWQAGGEDHVFGGLVFNPQDGNTYFAKMRQGLRGDWQFRLPYTAEPGEGTFLNMFYISLGHVSRVFDWNVVFSFHFFRILASVFLLVVLYRLSWRVFDTFRARWMAFLLMTLGAGLGWLVLPFEIVTADYWVAEAYPFLSMNTNIHFPVGLALQICLINPVIEDRITLKMAAGIIVMAFLLAVISPFGVPVVIVVLGGTWLWKVILGKRAQLDFQKVALVGLGSAPVLLYYFWVSKTHPVLAGWNAQNITLSPAWWDLLISFSPALLLAVPGAIHAWKLDRPLSRTMVVWAGLCLVLVYIPISLQRRFMIGLFVPLAVLAIYGLENIIEKRQKFKSMFIAGVYFLALPTTLLIMVFALFGIFSRDTNLYLTRGEVQALAWVEENLPGDILILSSSQIGRFIPAHTDARVLYGHPFETVDAERMEALVDGFFSDQLSQTKGEYLLTTHKVDYVFLGPRERALGQVPWLSQYSLVYSDGGVDIYSITEK